MRPLLPGLCTGRVFSDKEASGHMSIPTARETAGVQDDAAWLPGNSGHHGNAASTEGAGASAAPPAEEGRGRQWQGLCPDHPDDTCLPALPFSPARPLGQRLWGPGASTAQGWGPGVRPSSLSRHLPCVPALEPWFPHQPHTVATAAPPSPLAVSAPRQVLPRGQVSLLPPAAAGRARRSCPGHSRGASGNPGGREAGGPLGRGRPCHSEAG